MKRKVLSMLLAAIMVLSVTGCGEEKIKDDSPVTDVLESTEESKEEKEAKPAVTEESFMEYFPEELSFQSDKVIHIEEYSSDLSSAGLTNISVDLYKTKDSQYMSLSAGSMFDLKFYEKDEKQYAFQNTSGLYFSVIEADKESMEEIKDAYAKALNVSIEDITDDNIKEYLNNMFVSYGYTEKTGEESEDNFSDTANDMINIDIIQNIFSSYTKEELQFLSDKDDIITAKFETNGTEVYLFSDKNTKEISEIKFSQVMETEDESLNFVEKTIDVDILLKDFDEEYLFWITEDTEKTVKDVSEDFTYAILAYAFSSIDFDTTGAEEDSITTLEE